MSLCSDNTYLGGNFPNLCLAAVLFLHQFLLVLCLDNPWWDNTDDDVSITSSCSSVPDLFTILTHLLITCNHLILFLFDQSEQTHIAMDLWVFAQTTHTWGVTFPSMDFLFLVSLLLFFFINAFASSSGWFVQMNCIRFLNDCRI